MVLCDLVWYFECYITNKNKKNNIILQDIAIKSKKKSEKTRILQNMSVEGSRNSTFLKISWALNLQKGSISGALNWQISASADGRPRSRVRARGTLCSAPPLALAEFFRQTCLQSRLQTSPPTPQKSYPKIQNSTTSLSRKNLKLANFPVKIGLNEGIGVVSKKISDRNLYIYVTWKPTQRFETLW